MDEPPTHGHHHTTVHYDINLRLAAGAIDSKKPGR